MLLVGITQTINNTKFPSGKCLGEWRKDTFLSLSDVVTICLYINIYI